MAIMHYALCIENNAKKPKDVFWILTPFRLVGIIGVLSAMLTH